MAAVASRSQVSQIESQVRPLRNGDLMIRVEVACLPVVSIAKLGENVIRRWVAELEASEVPDDIGLPAAVHTPPAIAPEAEDPKATVVRVIPTLGGSAAAHVVPALLLPPVNLAGAAQREFWAVRHRAGMENAVGLRQCA